VDSGRFVFRVWKRRFTCESLPTKPPRRRLAWRASSKSAEFDVGEERPAVCITALSALIEATASFLDYARAIPFARFHGLAKRARRPPSAISICKKRPPRVAGHRPRLPRIARRRTRRAADPQRGCKPVAILPRSPRRDRLAPTLGLLGVGWIWVKYKI